MTTGAGAGGQLRVFLVDDHAIIRSGVRGYLELADDIIVAGEAAATGQQEWLNAPGNSELVSGEGKHRGVPAAVRAAG